MRSCAASLWDRWLEVPRRERLLLVGAMATSFALVVAYVVATRSVALGGDQPEYHSQGVLFAEGKLWWSTAPFGDAHPSAWKAPGYPAWIGFWYALLGDSPTRIELVQALLAPLTVLLTWLLARRLFTPRVAIVAAWVTAVLPLAWEYYGLLFPEALAVPLTVGALLVFLGREPTPARAAAAGALLGVNLLVRPSAFFLLAAIAAAWIVAAGWRRGAAMTAVTAAVAVLVVAPWTVRNAIALDGFVPISVQDLGAYGTFNDEAANDPDRPWGWRPVLQDQPAAFARAQRGEIGEPELRNELQDVALDYIRDNPSSVPKAMLWNGVLRFWDVRSPSEALDEVPFQGDSRTVRATGLAIYYVLLPLALVGLWRARRRGEIVIPVLAMVAATAIAFTVIGGTRYRAPVEPLVATLAAAAVLGARAGGGDRPDDGQPARPEARVEAPVG